MSLKEPIVRVGQRVVVDIRKVFSGAPDYSNEGRIGHPAEVTYRPKTDAEGASDMIHLYLDGAPPPAIGLAVVERVPDLVSLLGNRHDRFVLVWEEEE